MGANVEDSVLSSVSNILVRWAILEGTEALNSLTFIRPLTISEENSFEIVSIRFGE